MIRKYLNHLILAAVLLPGLTVMQSCERINEQKENGVQVASDYCSVQSEIGAIVEVADQIGDQTTAKGTPLKFFSDAFGKQAVITALDTTFFDGDGIEFEINFGPISLPLSENQKGYDGKYRAGKMHVKIQSHYQEKLSKLEVEIEKSDNFWVGRNPSQPHNVAGSFSMSRQDNKKHNISIESFEFFGQKTLTLNGEFQLTKLTSFNPGMIGNQYQLTGKGSILISENEKHNWEIKQPLIKKVVPGCSGEFVNGMIELNNDDKSVVIAIDYDPFENESCDRIVRATVAGKSTDITLD
ncbi:MAG: hypothetical protein ACO3AQ_05630 [Bacteroidia bacterium]